MPMLNTFEFLDKKILNGDFSELANLFYKNTVKNNIVIHENYHSQDYEQCSMWNKDLKNKRFLILDTEHKRKIGNDYFMLIAGFLYDDNNKTISTIMDKIKIDKHSQTPSKTIYNRKSKEDFKEFSNLLIEGCDYIVVHNYGADIPRLSNAGNIPEIILQNKTIDTFESSQQILASQKANFYSLKNLYKNLISYTIWISEDKKYVVFGTNHHLGHLLEIKISEFERLVSIPFQEHHPLFDAVLTFMLFLDFKSNYDNERYRVFHIDNNA